ncbi:MAG: substrate-binding domain-containing protein [Clostridiales bacterium]|nr:substrate-binding domain-containing protein [Candidatus Blautia equi]
MKKRIALCANGWNGENLDRFIQGFISRFEENEIDLFIFTGHPLLNQSLMVRNAENSIFTLPDYTMFDAVVVFGSAIDIDTVIDDIMAKCRQADIPIIFQGYDTEGVSSVVVDNYSGMRSLCEHIITEHGVKDVVYIAGTKENDDSNIRLSAVRDALEAHGYSLPEENIIYGDWDGRLVNTILLEEYKGDKKLPDAFMCANDITAMYTLLTMDMLKVKVPEEVIVTGFDNLGEAKVYNPSVASVDQCYFEQGGRCADIFRETVNNKKLIRKEIIPCVASPGESCGCVNCKDEDNLRKMLGHDAWQQNFSVVAMYRIEDFLEDCIMANESFDTIPDNMKDFLLHNAGEDDFHIYMNPQYKNLDDIDIRTLVLPRDYYSPKMEVWGAKTDGAIIDAKTLDTKELVLGCSREGKGKVYVFTPLRTDEFIAGYLVKEYMDKTFAHQLYYEFSNRINITLTKYKSKIKINQLHEREIESLKELNTVAKNQFLQTVLALATAVDAKDKYTHGHSRRVAEYSRKIAEITGKSAETCESVYFAALLHDIGKIGVSDAILTKEGRLTDAEFSAIKQHPVIGDNILAEISSTPYLSMGAHYHHERYDGKGYPSGLKGTDIPEIARIIAVADAYDAMTSNRSYRTPLAQQKVREELVRNIGRQFDPEFAITMIHILDKDVEYRLTDNTLRFNGFEDKYIIDEYKSVCTNGIAVSEHITRTAFDYECASDKEDSFPAIVLFDSLDECVYTDEANKNKMDYTDFCDISLQGHVVPGEIRDYRVREYVNDAPEKMSENEAMVETLKQRDHILIRLFLPDVVREYTIMLRDRSQWAYVAITGQMCTISNVRVHSFEENVEPGYIKRIAEEINYVKDKAEGDLKNLEITGWREVHSDGILVEDKLDVSFHSMSLPASRRPWHCPYVIIYTSENGEVNGPGYREFVQVRLDGECWSEDPASSNKMKTSYDDSFDNWDAWKKANREGLDCKVHIEKDGNRVRIETEDGGIHIHNITTISEEIVPNLYFALTGDQVAITTIYIR